MSAHVIQAEVRCDTRDCWSYKTGHSIANARYNAERNGWLRVGHADVCPKCQERQVAR